MYRNRFAAIGRNATVIHDLHDRITYDIFRDFRIILDDREKGLVGEIRIAGRDADRQQVGAFDIGDLDASLAKYGWMIRGYFESTTDMEAIGWTEDAATSGSYPITGLTPETTYIIQVRGIYGSDGKSDWVNSLFTTPAVNTAISIATDPSAKGKGSIYTIDGVKLDKMPTRKGVYIQNKRKLVVK